MCYFLSKKTTGVGFTFSSPYYYDGLTYFGNETFVRCAQEHRRYGDCSSLNICVVKESTSYSFVEFYFPSDFFTLVSIKVYFFFSKSTSVLIILNFT